MCPSGRGAGDGSKGVASNGVRRGYLGFADFGRGIRVRTLFPRCLPLPRSILHSSGESSRPAVSCACWTPLSGLLCYG